MKKRFWYLPAGLLLLSLLNGCGSPTTFPSKDVFLLQVTPETAQLSLTDELILDCTLYNSTNRTYTITSGFDIIGYTDEISGSVLKKDIFQAKETKVRRIVLHPEQKGEQTITVIACFQIVDPLSQMEKKYSFKETVCFTVQ